MKVGFKVFGDRTFNYGLEKCLAFSKYKAEPVTEKTAKYYDVILCSVWWWQHIYDFIRFCYDAGIGYKREKPHVIVGGFNTFNPYVLLPWAHTVYCGDGEYAVDNLIESALSPGKPIPGVWRDGYAEWQSVPLDKDQYSYEDKEANVTRIEIARGCKYRCRFCQIAHLKPYREVPYEMLRDEMGKVKTKRTALFAPERTLHSEWNKIKQLPSEFGTTDVGSDVRFSNILDFDTGTPHFGLEGLSERLRSYVGKPIKNDDIKTTIEAMLAQGRTSMLGYVILDLPGETEDDWAEFRTLLDELEDVPMIEHFTWIVCPNVFMPCPHTPLEREAVHYERNYRARWRKFIRDYYGPHDRKLTLMGRFRVFSEFSRVMSLIATRGDEQAQQILFNIATNKDLRKWLQGRSGMKLAGLREMIGQNNIEKYCGEPETMPWKGVKVEVEARKMP